MSTYKKPIFLIFTLPIIAALYWLVSGSSFFTVQKIECFTQYGQCPRELADVTSSLKNRKLLRPIPKPSLSSYPIMNKISFYRRLPSTLVVNIELKKPIGIIDKSLIDESGVVLGQTTSSLLPRLISDEISEIQIRSLKLLNLISPLISGQLIGQLSSRTLSVKSVSSPEILIDMDKPSQTWYPALQLLLEKSKIDGKIPRIIDLRYKEPVLTY